MKQNNKRSRSTIFLVGFVVFLSCLVIALGAFSINLIYKNPLGEPLGLILKQPTPTSAAPVLPTAVLGSEKQITPSLTPAPSQPTEAPTPSIPPTEQVPEQPAKTQPAGVCGNTGSLSVLFTGADFAGGNPPPGADAVRLARFDFDNRRITVVAFPRDLWVKTPSLAKYSIPETRLGLTYYYEKEYTPGDEQHKITAATSILAQTLYDNFEVEPNNYFTLELSNIAGMIDTIGGIEVDNPSTFVSDARMTFPAGRLVLYGDQAAEFVRTFNPGGESARLERQNLFMRALQNKVISAEILAKMPDLIQRFDQATYTDLSPKQLLALACMAQEVPQDRIIFQEIDGDLVRLNANKAMIPDVEKIRSRLKAWFIQ